MKVDATARAMLIVILNWEVAGARQVADLQAARRRRWLAKHCRPMPEPPRAA